MCRAPIPAGARVVDTATVMDIAIVGVVMTVGTLGMFFGYNEVLVLNLPFLERALSVVPLTPGQWARSFIVASSMLWAIEGVKWLRRSRASTESAQVSA